jgi:hypothetical protein
VSDFKATPPGGHPPAAVCYSAVRGRVIVQLEGALGRG